MSGASRQRLDLLLVFPPSFEHYFMPEMALPRLTAWLKGRGRQVEQQDWNVSYWGQYLFEERPFLFFLKWLKENHQPGDDCFYRPVRQLFDRFLNAGPMDLQACRRFVRENRREIFQWVHEQTLVTDYSLENVIALTRRSDPLLDRFLKSRIQGLLDRFEIPVLGLSLISPHQLVQTLKLVSAWRALNPQIKVVAGGPWVKLGRSFFRRPEYRFLFRFFDVLSFADGELPLERILQSGFAPDGLDAIPNLIHGLHGDRVTETPEEPSPSLSQLPAPTFDGLPLDAYLEAVLPVERASMCYWRKCAFCWHNHKDRLWNYLPQSQVVDRLEDYVSKYEIREFMFIDNAVDENYSASLAREILERGLEIRWTMQARLNREFLDPGYAELLHRSGCRGITFGLETASPEMLHRFRKGILLDSVPTILKNTAAVGIENNLFTMLYPGQTREDFETTLKFCLKVREVVGMVINQRFDLNEYCIAHDQPGLLGLTVLPDPRVPLDFFKLAYESDGCLTDDEYYRRTMDQFLRLMRSREPLPEMEGVSIQQLYDRLSGSRA